MKKKCKHRYQIFKRPERFEYTLGEFIALCDKCFGYKWINISNYNPIV